MGYFTGIFSLLVGNVDVTDPWQNDCKRNLIHTIQLLIDALFRSSHFGSHTSLNQSTVIRLKTLDNVDRLFTTKCLVIMLYGVC